MNLLLFGATGATGRHLLQQALHQGHRVTAFVRSPADLADIRHRRLRIVEGDVMHPSTIEPIMPGHDAVLVALGSRGHNTVLSAGTANIIWQMHQANIERLIVLSSLGVGESRQEMSWWFRHIFRPLVLSSIFTDKEKQESCVKQSGLDWTIVRPIALTDEPATGKVFAGPTLRGQSELLAGVPRADVAAFMLHQLGGGRWHQKAVALTGARRAFEDLTPNNQHTAPEQVA